MPFSPGTTSAHIASPPRSAKVPWGSYIERETPGSIGTWAVLPQAFIQEPDHPARFGREGEVLASLNQPHEDK